MQTRATTALRPPEEQQEAAFTPPSEEGATSAGAVAERPSTDLTIVDLGDDAGAGLEGLSTHEQLTPFLRILQTNSPQVNEREPMYVPGAKPGMLFNTATMEIYDGVKGVEMVVAARDYHFGMWVPRDAGGGFRGMLQPNDPIVAKLIKEHGRFKLPRFREGRWTGTPHEHEGEKVEVVETIQLYALYGETPASEANVQPAIIAYTSTALPVAQGYLTRHNNWRYKQPPSAANPNGAVLPAQLWSYRWRLSTVGQKNAKGSWFNYRIDLLPEGAKPVEALLKRTDPLWARGKELYEAYKSGQLKPDYDAAAATGGEPGADDVPF